MEIMIACDINFYTLCVQHVETFDSSITDVHHKQQLDGNSLLGIIEPEF